MLSVGWMVLIRFMKATSGCEEFRIVGSVPRASSNPALLRVTIGVPSATAFRNVQDPKRHARQRVTNPAKTRILRAGQLGRIVVPVATNAAIPSIGFTKDRNEVVIARRKMPRLRARDS